MIRGQPGGLHVRVGLGEWRRVREEGRGGCSGVGGGGGGGRRIIRREETVHVKLRLRGFRRCHMFICCAKNHMKL